MPVTAKDMQNLTRRTCVIWAGLQKQMPLTFRVYLVGALALSGIVPLAGFFSKDEILAAANEKSIFIFVSPGSGGFPDSFLYGPPASDGLFLAKPVQKRLHMPLRAPLL